VRAPPSPNQPPRDIASAPPATSAQPGPRSLAAGRWLPPRSPLRACHGAIPIRTDEPQRPPGCGRCLHEAAVASRVRLHGGWRHSQRPADTQAWREAPSPQRPRCDRIIFNMRIIPLKSGRSRNVEYEARQCHPLASPAERRHRTLTAHRSPTRRRLQTLLSNPPSLR